MNPLLKTLNILLVEDSPDDVFFFTNSAAKLRVGRVQHAPDGEEAKAFLSPASALPDIIVTDLKMPRCGGIELLEWIRSHTHLVALPVVVLSSSGHAHDQKLAYAAGATAYFIKPSRYSEYDMLWSTLVSFVPTANEGSAEQCSA